MLFSGWNIQRVCVVLCLSVIKLNDNSVRKIRGKSEFQKSAKMNKNIFSSKKTHKNKDETLLIHVEKKEIKFETFWADIFLALKIINAPMESFKEGSKSEKDFTCLSRTEEKDF